MNHDYVLTITFIAICAIHWIADFVFQDEQWAINKWHDNGALFKHVLVYSIIWAIPCLFYAHYTGHHLMALFPVVTFVAHFITDYFTSKSVHRLFAKNELGSSIPNFGAFSAIGYDQHLLHLPQLFLTFYFLN